MSLQSLAFREKDLKEAGYTVYPVNPNIDEIFGEICYHSLSELLEKPDVVDTVVPPKVESTEIFLSKPKTKLY